MWLQVENIALGEPDSTGRLITSADSVENHLATDSSADSAGSVPVTIGRGDTICARLGQAPNVIKLDVEGFEEEVLAGMAETLASHGLRSLLAEVHFSKLERPGYGAGPNREAASWKWFSNELGGRFASIREQMTGAQGL